MKKQITSLIITAAIISSCNVFAQASFKGLTTTIERYADTWISTSLSPLSYEDRLTYLNLFVDPTESSIESTIKCAQTIQGNVLLSNATEALQTIMQTIIEKYVDAMQTKFEQRKTDPTKEELQEFWQKLEQKIYELIGYFNQIFYKKLYNHLEQENSEKLFIMFSENGVIAQNNRTRSLPKPA